jgi:hypothetical protein
MMVGSGKVKHGETSTLKVNECDRHGVPENRTTIIMAAIPEMVMLPVLGPSTENSFSNVNASLPCLAFRQVPHIALDVCL